VAAPTRVAKPVILPAAEPSWPWSFAPQQRSAPAMSMAQVWYAPALSVRKLPGTPASAPPPSGPGPDAHVSPAGRQ
jgi:hypothetical protein